MPVTPPAFSFLRPSSAGGLRLLFRRLVAWLDPVMQYDSINPVQIQSYRMRANTILSYLMPPRRCESFNPIRFNLI